MYLQFDGIDDFLQLPSFQMDSIELDVIFEPNGTGFQLFVDARSGLSNGYALSTNGTEFTVAAGFTVNDTQLVWNTRTQVLLTSSTGAFTDDVTIFRHNSSNGFFGKGKLYKITCRLAGNVVALYDTNTETVQDQSGNGRHGTLTGGTFVSEGGGSVAGAATLSGAGSLTASGTVQISGGASLSGLGSLTVTGTPFISGGATVSGTGSLTANGTVDNGTASGAATLTGIGSLIATGTMTINGGASLTGTGVLTASGRATGWMTVAGASTTWNQGAAQITTWNSETTTPTTWT